MGYVNHQCGSTMLKLQLAFRDGANKTIDKLQSNIREKAPTQFGPMNNTGEAANSLNYRWVSENRIQVYSDMPGQFNYIMTLETGRAPGKRPPTSPILDWIKSRGIQPADITQKSLAFLIARKIGLEGSLVFRKGGNTGIISEVQSEQWIIDNFVKPLELELNRGFTDVLREVLN